MKKLFQLSLAGLLTLGLLSLQAFSQQNKTILGAGATFPYPLYAAMFAEYNKKYDVKVNYQSIGSGGGIRQLKARVVEFGATDTFIKDNALAKYKENGQIVHHIPIVLGAVAVTFNLNTIKNIRLNGETLAHIFNGAITRWNHPALRKLNPGLPLPNRPIIVVRRSDGSGTTSVFSEFLAASSHEWKNSVGVGKSLNWFRSSIGAKGNEGVTGQIKSIPGAIGYVSLNYALAAKLPVIAIANADDKFVKPSVASVSAAANVKLPADTRLKLSTHPAGKASYPISTFTWIVFYADQSYNGRTREQAETFKELLSWMVTKGQKNAQPLYYAPLPKAAQKAALNIIDKIHFAGESL